jgi:hypothetical protein
MSPIEAGRAHAAVGDGAGGSRGDTRRRELGVSISIRTILLVAVVVAAGAALASIKYMLGNVVISVICATVYGVTALILGLRRACTCVSARTSGTSRFRRPADLKARFEPWSTRLSTLSADVDTDAGELSPLARSFVQRHGWKIYLWGNRIGPPGRGSGWQPASPLAWSFATRPLSMMSTSSSRTTSAGPLSGSLT